MSALRHACDEGPRGRPPTRIYVFLELDATQSEIDAVGAELDQSRLISSATYSDRDTTLAEYQDAYADQPEVLDLLDPDQLPRSWVGEVDAGAGPEAVGELQIHLRSIAGVSGTRADGPPGSEYCFDVR